MNGDFIHLIAYFGELIEEDNKKNIVLAQCFLKIKDYPIFFIFMRLDYLNLV